MKESGVVVVVDSLVQAVENSPTQVVSRVPRRASSVKTSY